MRCARLTPFIVPDVPEVRVLSWLPVLLARCEKSDRRARETSSGVVSRKGETPGPFGRPNEEKSVASCHAPSRLQDLTKAMATGQMWTQAQPAERACRGAAAAERRLNGVAYTAPKSRLPKKTER